MSLAVISVLYNLPANVLLLQIEALKKYCKDPYDLIIVDNSSDLEMSEAIRYHCANKQVEYLRTQASSMNGSDSHAFALNVAHNHFKSDYDTLLYLDHDVIPYKEFSPSQILLGYDLAGVMQGKKKHYLWPGCMFISKEMIPNIDFSPNNRLGLDTGGNNYKIIEKAKVRHFSEQYRQNDQYNGFYNFYTIIEETFIHFINASNWNNAKNNQDRLNSLINIYGDLQENPNLG